MMANQALLIALLSYAGGLYWGFNADWDALPDLHQLVEAIDSEFGLLRSAAALGPLPIAGKRKRSAAGVKPRHAAESPAVRQAS